jgi:hypothetical protein
VVPDMSALDFVNMSIAQLEEKAQEVEARAAALGGGVGAGGLHPHLHSEGRPTGLGRAWSPGSTPVPLAPKQTPSYYYNRHGGGAGDVGDNRVRGERRPTRRGGRAERAQSRRDEQEEEAEHAAARAAADANAEEQQGQEDEAGGHESEHEGRGARARRAMDERRSGRASRQRQMSVSTEGGRSRDGWEQPRLQQLLQQRVDSALRHVDGLSGQIAEIQRLPQQQWGAAPPPALPPTAWGPHSYMYAQQQQQMQQQQMQQQQMQTQMQTQMHLAAQPPMQQVAPLQPPLLSSPALSVATGARGRSPPRTSAAVDKAQRLLTQLSASGAAAAGQVMRRPPHPTPFTA